MMKFHIAVILTLLLLPGVAAQATKEGHIKLLAVNEAEDGFEGKAVDLTLEIQKGKGRVFLETYPLTRADTQISTRFAKEIACEHLNLDCEGLDFIYTIKADSTVVGGPSAGAAIAVLTVALLNDLTLDESTTITGTITSGGLIGPVGGLKEKILAASQSNLTTVLIPPDSIEYKEEDNETIDFVEFGLEHGVTVKEAASLEQALYFFTGKEFTTTYEPISIETSYTKVMQGLADQLCERSDMIRESINESFNFSAYPDSFNLIQNLSGKAQSAYDNGSYYSAASYCFGANSELQYLHVTDLNFSTKEFAKQVEKLQTALEEFNQKIDAKKRETITDLQAYMIVKERLTEAQDNLNAAIDNFNNNNTEYLRNIAYTNERFYSALSWSRFFGTGGKSYELDEEKLKESCIRRLNEADVRISYVRLVLPGTMESAMRELDHATSDFNNENYELCLFKASQAKAEADAVLNIVGVSEEKLDNVINTRARLVERKIVESTAKRAFPILGYSYYEYAQDLHDEMIYSSLFYYEYALEMSNLDKYFEEKIVPKKQIDGSQFYIFIAGMFIGVVLVIIALKRPKKR